jgi:hypothetical protein
MALPTHLPTRRTKPSPFRSPRAGPLLNVDIACNLLEFRPFYAGTPEFQLRKLQYHDCQAESRFVPDIVFFFHQHPSFCVPCSDFEVFEARFVISGLFITNASQIRPVRVSDPPSGPIQCHKQATTPIGH